MKEIKISVAMPLWKAKPIVWLAIESLCRQENAPEWELLIAEEQVGEFVGKEFVDSYRERLESANCKRIVYIPLDEWVSLSQKWYILSQKLSDSSIGVLLQAADCYSFKSRIRYSHKMMSEGYDWIHAEKGYFYDINMKLWRLYNVKGCPTGLNMGIHKKLVKKMPKVSNQKRKVDNWLKGQLCPQKTGKIDPGASLDGFDTNGRNTISKSRKKMFETRPDIYNHTKYNGELVPLDIMKRLRSM